MNTEIDALIARVNAGDESALAELCDIYEPYLRLVVNRHLPSRFRGRFDPSDVLQSVWVSLLRDIREKELRFDSPEKLRGFLALVVRNRLLNRLRHHRRSVDTEAPLPAGSPAALVSPQPGPSERAQADDLWERLLADCPLEHRKVLCLKREGHSADEIASRVGWHPGSVRRVFYDLARRLSLG